MSLEGFRYYVSFINECTRYTWIFPLMNKAGVFNVFVQFLAFVSNFFYAKVKIVQSYWGGGVSILVLSFKVFFKKKVLFIKNLVPILPNKMG